MATAVLFCWTAIASSCAVGVNGTGRCASASARPPPPFCRPRDDPPPRRLAPVARSPADGRMALLADTVETWRRVSATRSRIAKVRALTEWLVRLAPPEIEIGVTWLAGETRQGRIGIGHSALQVARQASATTVPVLTLTQVDAQLASIAAQRGAGSTARRTQALRDLFAAATPAEQAFLARLLLGELRQGALAALMLEAVAAAARI